MPAGATPWGIQGKAASAEHGAILVENEDPCGPIRIGAALSKLQRHADRRRGAVLHMCGAEEIASTASTEARPRRLFAPFGPLWHAKSRTMVDSRKHPSYINLPLASRRLCSLHRSSDTHRAQPLPDRTAFDEPDPFCRSANQHLCESYG
jgi:hypothetical protein